MNCYGKYTDTNIRKAQIVYLRAEKNKDWDSIADLVGYAVSTVKSYYYKFKSFLTDIKNFFEDKVNELVNLVYKKTQTPRKNVVYECECVADGTPTAYVAEVFEDDKFLFTKIGFSNQVLTRMNEHATNKKYGTNLTVLVKDIYCFADEEDAKEMEVRLRKFFKRRNNERDYVKQDRFTEQRVTAEILSELAEIPHTIE